MRSIRLIPSVGVAALTLTLHDGRVLGSSWYHDMIHK